MDELDEEFKYRKRDFLKLGIKKGSFYKLIKDLNLDTPDYCKTVLGNGSNKIRYFNQEAYNIIVQYINKKGIKNTRSELALTNENIELKAQNQKLQNALTMLESKHTKEIADLKDEWHEKENEWHNEREKLKEELRDKMPREEYDKLSNRYSETYKELYTAQQENERLKNRSFWKRLLNKF